MLVFTCVATPVRIAFESVEPSTTALVTDIVIDSLFFIDMIIIFNKAYFDQKAFKLVSDRAQIAKGYLQGWFWIDLFAIIPM